MGTNVQVYNLGGKPAWPATYYHKGNDNFHPPATPSGFTSPLGFQKENHIDIHKLGGQGEARSSAREIYVGVGSNPKRSGLQHGGRSFKGATGRGGSSLAALALHGRSLDLSLLAIGVEPGEGPDDARAPARLKIENTLRFLLCILMIGSSLLVVGSSMAGSLLVS